MRRAALVTLILIVAVALFVGLHPVSPARTFDDYAHKAKDTAESALSSVQTARLGARVGSNGHAFGPYVSVVLSESERGVAKAQGVFESVQPPDHHADAMRARLGKLLQRASDVLGRLRITARRGQLERLARVARPLAPLADRFDAFIQVADRG